MSSASSSSHIRSISAEFFAFQRDSAPAHRACDTVEMLSRETPDFMSALQWPPNSPDLNPVDYAVWCQLQERVYCVLIRDVDHVVERLVEEWSRFDMHEIISAAVTQWPARLCACMKLDGGHFEHFV